MTAKQLIALLMQVPENSEVYVSGERSCVYMGVMTQVQGAAIYTRNALDISPFAVLIAPVELTAPPLDEEYYNGGQKYGAAAEPKGKMITETKKQTSRRVDRGKILALGRAGWKAADIAREAKCSVNTVRNVIREELDKEDKND